MKSVMTLACICPHTQERVFVIPNRVQCMYSGDIALMKSKYLKQYSQEGPLTPLTYNIVYKQKRSKQKKMSRKEHIDMASMVYSSTNTIMVFTMESVSTASFTYWRQASAVLGSPFGDSVWYGKMRTLPLFSVRKFFPGCSQKLHS